MPSLPQLPMSSQPVFSPFTHRLTPLPWGCKIMINIATELPVHTEIFHYASCLCNRFGGERDVARDFLIVVCTEFYHKKDPEQYNKKWCAKTLKAEAQQLGIEKKHLKAGLQRCVPWRKCFRRYDVVKVNGKLVSTPVVNPQN